MCLLYNKATTYRGNLNSLYVGRRTDGTLSRVLMRFPKLDLSEIASGGSIQEATISVRDLMCQSDENITVDPPVFRVQDINIWAHGSVRIEKRGT